MDGRLRGVSRRGAIERFLNGLNGPVILSEPYLEGQSLVWHNNPRFLGQAAWPGSAGLNGLMTWARGNGHALTASQLTTYSGYVASLAVDGNAGGTSLSATGSSGATWWQVALPVGEGIRATHWGVNTYPDSTRPRLFTLYGSLDGSTWTELYNNTATLGSGVWNGGLLDVRSAVPFRYFRIVQPDNGNASSGDQLTLREVEIYGSYFGPPSMGGFWTNE